MKGVVFILILYVAVLMVSALVKYFFINYFNDKKRSESPASTSKIYYIKNSSNPAPKKPQKIDIAIKGRVVEKEDN